MPPTPARTLALAVGAVVAVAALAGCGASRSTQPDEMALTVTRDFGATSFIELNRERVPKPPGLARILSRYPQPRARASLFVNGIAADEPAAKVDVHGGDRVWLDQHDSAIATPIPAVVGSFPEPFVNGIGGKRLPVRVECDDPRSGP
ncbi:MAG TPA: hypothetical protein VFZ89_08390, partial [Solirubrobacteraceae bacterium]